MTLQLSFLPEIAAVFMLMFARLGTMIMIMPALGESSIPARLRLTIALALTLILYPTGSATYPANVTDNLLHLLTLFGGELAVGFAVGLCAKLVAFTLQTAGVIIASQSGMAFALGTDISNAGQQGALFGNYLSILGVTLVFVTNSHYLVISALHDSFAMFPPGHWLPLGDFAAMATQTVADVFSVAVRMAAPFIVVGIVFYFGLGLLNKLMPQMQIFFIAMPVNIVIGLALLLVLLGAIMTFYMDHFQKALGMFTAG
ncbi:flagellar biosynthetic protein FliR [Roseibium aggregatum]|uniref:Flagellar biosynthetic protein FliR n=1 Tax=Roseibium aggregatum TaxID=187304 RepID=A0A926P231_9HYPH|nr:flagellar biosynthetic protein FliR [Roseibium aggregatum]MBD1548060.1 flagellar type III secretion system protein FliR [Roseibium aggregatum]